MAKYKIMFVRPLQKDLPAECADFTVGLCNPNADEQIDSYPIPDGPTASSICQVGKVCIITLFPIFYISILARLYIFFVTHSVHVLYCVTEYIY
jgi:hypothetical protein